MVGSEGQRTRGEDLIPDLDLLPLESLPTPPGGVLVPQFPDVAVPASRQVCRVHRDEVIGCFTLLSFPSRQEEHLGETEEVTLQTQPLIRTQSRVPLTH